MKGDCIVDEDHILRYVGGSHIETAQDGTPVITGGGFIAKPKDDNKPSYNWLECFTGALDDQVQKVRDLARVTYGSKGKLVRLNVGRVRCNIAENTDDNRAITVIEDPLDAEDDKPADPSHALMTNVPDENDPQGELVGDLIAQCVLNVFPAKIGS
jgi:hypothetical protein